MTTKDVLVVRDPTPGDISLVKTYWMNQTVSDIERMKLDVSRIPARVAQVEAWLDLSGVPHRRRTSDLLIWNLNGETVGMSTLRNIRYGDSGEIHLHMIDTRFRQRGYGHRFFLLCLQEFFARFELQIIVCEPSSTNPGPNRLLQRLGFDVVKTYRTVPSDLNLEHEVNRYEITASRLRTAAASL
jgi:RimJ/RimL family protein N-acetyltransferase